MNDPTQNVIKSIRQVSGAWDRLAAQDFYGKENVGSATSKEFQVLLSDNKQYYFMAARRRMQ